MKTYCLTVVAALASAILTLMLFQDVALLASRDVAREAVPHGVRAAAPVPLASASPAERV